MDSQIFFEGFCTDIAGRLRSMDALVCASTDESFPQAILEAMAMNIPVISTPVAGVPELIKDGYTGYLTEGFTAVDIENAIYRYINDFNDNSDNINKLIINASKVADDECSREGVSAKLFKFYETALSNRHEYNEEKKDIKRLNKVFFESQNFDKAIYTRLNELQCRVFKRYLDRCRFGIIYKLNYLKGKFKDKPTRYIIWGASNGGKITYEVISNILPQFHLAGFIDKFKDGEFEGVKIYKPAGLNNLDYDYVFIATEPGREEAANFLMNMDMHKNRNFMSILF